MDERCDECGGLDGHMRWCSTELDTRLAQAREDQEEAINRSLAGMIRFMEADEGKNVRPGSGVAEVRRDQGQLA